MLLLRAVLVCAIVAESNVIVPAVTVRKPAVQQDTLASCVMRILTSVLFQMAAVISCVSTPKEASRVLVDRDMP
jgi:hypothetical protein